MSQIHYVFNKKIATTPGLQPIQQDKDVLGLVGQHAAKSFMQMYHVLKSLSCTRGLTCVPYAAEKKANLIPSGIHIFLTTLCRKRRKMAGRSIQPDVVRIPLNLIPSHLRLHQVCALLTAAFTIHNLDNLLICLPLARCPELEVLVPKKIKSFG